ncbi:heterodisulfide reductase-related iron-sulfur binding cluster [Flavobacterium sp.]|uniref:heterodisulfide reductase-related iron-sulfur binding cluster n=1 Tax=Flavobacterium sp. TaxID=239 RepID=UPI00261E69B3|nr:(Fe-S)-binding protein [Flavobacterium sp.]
MEVALFVPCYIDQFYPNVGIVTLQLLEKVGCKVTFPLQQTCCGQPLIKRFLQIWQGYVIQILLRILQVLII